MLPFFRHPYIAHSIFVGKAVLDQGVKVSWWQNALVLQKTLHCFNYFACRWLCVPGHLSSREKNSTCEVFHCDVLQTETRTSTGSSSASSCWCRFSASLSSVTHRAPGARAVATRALVSRARAASSFCCWTKSQTSLCVQLSLSRQ